MSMWRSSLICKLPSPFDALAAAASSSREHSGSEDLAIEPPSTRRQTKRTARRQLTSHLSTSCPALMIDAASAGGSGACEHAATPAITVQPRRNKIGRPITYTGDPNYKDLSEAERRRIKRRIANRESARRVRQKRQQALGGMQERLEAEQQKMTALAARLQHSEAQGAALAQQAAQIRGELAAAQAKRNAPRRAEAAAGFCFGSTPSSEGAPPLLSTGPSALPLSILDLSASTPAASRNFHLGSHGGTVTSGFDDARAVTAPPASSAGGLCAVVSAGAARSAAPSGGRLAAPDAAATHPTSVSVMPSAGTMRLFCAAPPAMAQPTLDLSETAAPAASSAWAPQTQPAPLPKTESIFSTGEGPLEWLASQPSLQARLPSMGLDACF